MICLAFLRGISFLEDMVELLFLSLVAAFAGALNSVAGGGTFFLFPTLMAAGLSPVAANITSSIAVWPASVTGALAYRKNLRISRSVLVALALVSLVGGALGSGLLLWLPEQIFENLVPFLLLAATALYSFGPYVRRWFKPKDMQALTLSWPVLLGQLMVSVYGGYFGAGIGILMLALLTAWGLQDTHTMNALKTVLGIFINGVAVLIFCFSGQVDWAKALVLVPAGLLGGYVGAHFSLKVSISKMRIVVSVCAWCITLYYCAKHWLPSLG